MQDSDRRPANTSRRLWLLALPSMVAVLALLRFYPLAQMNLAGALVVTVLLAWLIYHFNAPLRFIRRHALLSHVTAEQSLIRRWLWNSFLLKFTLALSALVLALLVLTLVAGFSMAEWWLMLAGVPLYAALFRLAQTLVGTQSSDQYQFPYTVRITHWLLVAVMAVAMVVLNLVWADVADTRQLLLSDVTQQAFAAGADSAAMTEIGWLLGISAALNDATWHLMQVAAASESAGSGLKILAWISFLTFNAVKAGVLWTVCGGVLILVDGQLRNRVAMLGQSRFGRAFSVSMLILFGMYLLLTQVNIGQYLDGPAVTARERLARVAASVTLSDPCRNNAITEQQNLLAVSGQALTAEQEQARQQMLTQITRHVDAAYVNAGAGVDAFLDWNFSLRGQYAQLAYMGASAVGETTFSGFIADKMDELVGAQLNPQIREAEQVLQVEYQNQAQQLLSRQAALVEQLAGSVDCLELPASTLSLQEHMHKSPVGAGSGAGILVARASMRMGTRVVGKTASRRVVSGAFGRLSGRLVTSSAAGASGAFCGPLVLVCAPLLAAGAWIATDLAINEVDQAINREDMRQDMLAVLDEDRQRLESLLVQHYSSALMQLTADVEAYQQQRFSIIRDGI